MSRWRIGTDGLKPIIHFHYFDINVGRSKIPSHAGTERSGSVHNLVIDIFVFYRQILTDKTR